MIAIPEVQISKLTRHDRDRASVARLDDVNHREIGLRNSRLALHKGRSEQICCKFDPTRYTMHHYHRIYVAGNRSGNPRSHVEGPNCWNSARHSNRLQSSFLCAEMQAPRVLPRMLHDLHLSGEGHSENMSVETIASCQTLWCKSLEATANTQGCEDGSRLQVHHSDV